MAKTAAERKADQRKRQKESGVINILKPNLTLITNLRAIMPPQATMHLKVKATRKPKGMRDISQKAVISPQGIMP